MSAYGYKFIFFTVIFFSFLSFLVSMGFDRYLSASIPDLATIDPTNFVAIFLTIITNPFSAYGFLSWFCIGLIVTDIYIILYSVT